MKRGFWGVACCIALVVAFQPFAADGATGSGTIDPSVVDAKGRREAILSVPAWGRWAVTIDSPQRSSLQLIDRRSGPGVVVGVAGEANGRLDLFLERGEYKLIVGSDPKGTGEAKLAVHPFTELHTPKPPLLVELKSVSAALGDFQQRSYWMEVKERRSVALEAAGRNLSDLRLWANGEWLVDATANCRTIEPIAGKPLRDCQLAPRLEPGMYLVTAYGGEPLAWAEDSGDHPFYLRTGIPRLGTAGRQRLEVSPFGIDRWLAPKSANYHRIELPESRSAKLSVSAFREDAPFADADQTELITKQSLIPVARLERRYPADHLVTVTAAAGQPYVLQHFDSGFVSHFGGRSYWFDQPGPHWISTVHSGDPNDSIDATGILARQVSGETDRSHEVVAEQVIDFGQRDAWVRRCNLLDTLTLFIKIPNPGRRQVVARGVAAKVRIEPFMVTLPKQYEAPDLQPTGSVWDLEAGFHVLTVVPDKHGIIDLGVQPPGGNVDELFARIGKDPITPLVQFPRIELAAGTWYGLFGNHQPEVDVGLVMRKLPLDLTDPLPISLQPGEEVRIAVHQTERGRIVAVSEDGTPVEVFVGAGKRKASLEDVSGKLDVTVRNSNDHRVQVALSFQPRRLATDAPLPVLSDANLPKPPKLAELSSQKPQFFDLDRLASKTFALRVDEPALYRLESSGLLATEGNLRTRVTTSLSKGSQNGTGRNFFVQEYLGEGDYQFSVSTLGETRGHLGVTLTKTAIRDGGTLTEGIRTAVALPAGEAVVYQFEVPVAGRYRVRSLGAAAPVRCRLEDADAWPIEAPGIPADITRTFEPGTYRLFLLPEPVEARRVTLVERIPEELKFGGHGPHNIGLDQRVAHLWREPTDGANREPDVWRFTLPATADVTIDLTDGMQGEIILNATSNGTAARVSVPAAKNWSGSLSAGDYRLEVMSGNRNDRQPYQLEIRPLQMVAGANRTFEPPVEIPVAVGPSGLTEIRSFGTRDVRCRLLDASGKQVAMNDDATDDWNCRIQQRLPEGKYRLSIDAVAPPLPLPTFTPTPIAEEGGEEYDEERTENDPRDGGEEEGDPSEHDGEERTEEEGAPGETAPTPIIGSAVSMRVMQEIADQPAQLPLAATVSVGNHVQILPIITHEDAEVIVIAAQATEEVGVSVEITGETGSRVLGTASGRVTHLEIPVVGLAERRGPSQIRIHVWSVDGRQADVRVRVASFTPPRVSEEELRHGVHLAPVADIDPPVGMIAVNCERPGAFRLTSEEGETRTSSLPGVAATTDIRSLSAALGSTMWIAADLQHGGVGGRVIGSRLLVGSGPDAAVSFSDITRRTAIDLERNESGPTVVRASSMTGQPGVALLGDEVDASGRPAIMAVGPRTAANVALGSGAASALFWPAGGRGDSLDIRVEQFSFAAPSSEPAPWGSHEEGVPAGAARARGLPSGHKQIRLALARGLVAALSTGDRLRSVHGTGLAAVDETIESTATTLTLLNLSAAEVRYHLEILPASEKSELLVTPSHVHESNWKRAGTLRLDVRIPDTHGSGPHRIHVRGGTALSIDKSGNVMRGPDIDLPLRSSGATLVIEHGAGPLLAWLDTAGDANNVLWSDQTGAVHPLESLPARLPLDGKVTGFQATVTERNALRVRTSTAAISRVRRGDEAPVIEIHPDGVRLDLLLEPGQVEVGLRALSGSNLSGWLEVSASPVTELREGLGAEILMPSDTTRFFSFRVDSRRAIGIGVRADPDVVECRLLDAAGKEIGRGVVQMATLEAGTYFLALSTPPDAPPVRARPVLAGIALPNSGPPEEVMRQYRTSAGAEPLGVSQ